MTPVTREEAAAGVPGWTGRIQTRRVYSPPSPEEGRRFLVDRIWPRGLSRDDPRVGEWVKEVAPSDELRKSFGHRPDRWEEFRRRYFGELDARPEAWRALLEAARRGPVTLVFSARDEERNNAAALKEYLEARLEAGGAA